MVSTLASGQLDKITLSELLSALSHALDLTEGQPAGHCVRCSRIGVEIGREIGLNGWHGHHAARDNAVAPARS